MSVRQLAQETGVNKSWRAKRIQGELFKLGIKVSKETVQKYMRRARQGLPPLRRGQTWATFLANHAGFAVVGASYRLAPKQNNQFDTELAQRNP